MDNTMLQTHLYNFTTQAHTKYSLIQFMTVKLASLGRLKIGNGIWRDYGQLPNSPRLQCCNARKGREVDCVEPFNSAELLRHSNMLSPPELIQISTMCSGTHSRHLVCTCIAFFFFFSFLHLFLNH